MIDLSAEKLEEARERDGEAADSRPSWAEDAIAPEEELQAMKSRKYR